MSKKQNNLFFLIWGAFALLFLLTFNIQSYNGKRYALPYPDDTFYNNAPIAGRSNAKIKTEALFDTLNEENDYDGYFIVMSDTFLISLYYWQWDSASLENERTFYYASSSSVRSNAVNSLGIRTRSLNAKTSTSNYGSWSSTSGFTPYWLYKDRPNPYYFTSYNFIAKDSNGNISYPITEEPDDPITPPPSGGDGESHDYTGILGIIQNLIRSIIDKLSEMLGFILEPLTFITDYITERLEELTSISDKLMLVVNNLLTRFESYTLEPIITFFSGLSAGAIAFYMAFYNLPILNDLFLAVLTLAVVGLILKLLEV